VRGDTIDIFPAHYEDRAWRVTLFGDEVDSIYEFDPLTGTKPPSWTRQDLRQFALRDAAPTLAQATKGMREELRLRLEQFRREGKLLEAQRLEQRTMFDLEMIEATGSCAGIETIPAG
jgi:excinuclease ABC subunit B